MQRWPDRDRQRWPLIAAAVAAVGDELAAGAWTVSSDVDDEPGESGVVTVAQLGPMSPTERGIVRSWFQFEEVCVDPWDETLQNGRHRLWATRRYFRAGLVPVASPTLEMANPDDYGRSRFWPECSREDLDQLDKVRWFDRTDPLNQRYLRALRTAAGGEFPSPV
ncbi:hypothetical protein [Microlunatus sp. GCM10028923]|uniref:hypothetical protein n=1 Tax=Microlunatus sp. GCM10028923 TaxID=3273400 RepID=UPI003611FDCE